MAACRRSAGAPLVPLLFCAIALVAAMPPSTAPLPRAHATSGPGAAVASGACEMVLDGPTCQRRCECEWCPPSGPDHGCHAINLEGPCGGRAGQRAPHDDCYEDPAAGLEGLAVGALFGGLAMAVVVLWCCWRRIRSLHRGPNHERSALNSDEHAPLVETAPKSETADVESGPKRPPSRPIDMPRPRPSPYCT
ncbi:hypothetical protein pkur_cds_780 [Pandoravirus kuranda]|uniref:Uncharacterized protein n=1 Tax=Pandoravirus kuranda TaxID=3019033 RepID=A0AA95J2H8_9VIRU|nr:hypothetical protein pkur_cds_780 [Pandoravirus kuranda]